MCMQVTHTIHITSMYKHTNHTHVYKHVTDICTHTETNHTHTHTLNYQMRMVSETQVFTTFNIISSM